MEKDLISRVYAREVLDSRGNPTVEVEVRDFDSYRTSDLKKR